MPLHPGGGLQSPPTGKVETQTTPEQVTHALEHTSVPSHVRVERSARHRPSSAPLARQVPAVPPGPEPMHEAPDAQVLVRPTVSQVAPTDTGGAQ